MLPRPVAIRAPLRPSEPPSANPNQLSPPGTQGARDGPAQGDVLFLADPGHAQAKYHAYDEGREHGQAASAFARVAQQRSYEGEQHHADRS
jgi:hypothetical protein